VTVLGLLAGCGGGGHTKSLSPAKPAAAAAAVSTVPAPAISQAAVSGGLKAAALAVLAAAATGDWGTFWDHWDAASQALIGRDEYLRRKQVCPGTTGAPITVVSEFPGANGIWTVRGRRGGSVILYQFRYERGQWAYVVTDPSVKASLKATYEQYVARPGCKV
jgi:hypothetical protein